MVQSVAAWARRPARSDNRARGRFRIACTEKTKRYNEVMLEKMQWDPAAPYQYSFERGLYYHHILPDKLLCGSQPTNGDDVRYLREAENVDVILSMQQPKDPEYWGVDTGAIHARMAELGVTFYRSEVKDFDPDSLRATLPATVHLIAKSLADSKKVYVHCTAGLGRAPAACIAYLFWFEDYNLDEAYEAVTRIRPCGPKRDAVRGATYDICSGGDWNQFAALPPHAYSTLQSEDRHFLQYHIFKRNAA